MKLERWKNIGEYNKHMKVNYDSVDELIEDSALFDIDVVKAEDGAFYIDYYGEWNKEDLE